MSENKPEYIKYPPIPEVEILNGFEAKSIYAFEKIDGGNSQIRTGRGRIYIGSRGGYINNQTVKNVNWFEDFQKWAYQQQENLLKIPEELICFGEWLAAHTIDYPQEVRDKFYLFDIYDLEKGLFLTPEEWKERLDENLENLINPIDLFKKGCFGIEELTGMLHGKSLLYNGPKEGLIFKDYKNQEFYKILHPTFAEIRKLNNEGEILVTVKAVRKAHERLLEKGEEVNEEELVAELRADIQKERGIVLEKKKTSQMVEIYLRHQKIQS